MSVKHGLIPVVLATGLIAAGCGEDEATGGIETSELSKQEWLVEANQACKHADNIMNQEGRKMFADGEPTEAEMRHYALDVVIPAFRDTIETIRALGAPAGDEQQVEAILTAQEEGTDRIEQDPLTIFQEDAPSRADRLAGEYGLTTCAGGADGD